MKTIAATAASLLALTFLTATTPAGAKDAATKAPHFTRYRHPVTIWIPPYAVDLSKTQLMAATTDAGMKDGITHLDLQFWTPTLTGAIEKVGGDSVSDDKIAELRDWAHDHGIRVMLCVFNGSVKWDWPLARAAFADHQTDFVHNLVAEADRLQLDGVDIDLEGPDTYAADKEPFVAFMTALSKELHARKKHLTVDSFTAFQWNAPNESWWPELFPVVDGIASMGYDDSGMAAPDWRSYAEQKKTAGKYAGKLQIGMPSDKDKWRGNTALEQLAWVKQDSTMGVAIWDAQLPSPTWQTPGVWKILKDIREGK